MGDTVTAASTAEDAATGAGDPRPRWRRALRPAVVVVVVLALGRVLFVADTASDVMQLPDAGLVRAALLDDGTPVFLSHLPDDSVHVVEAFTPEAVGPIGGFVGWCPAAEQFVDPHHGSLYDQRGQRQTVSVPGRVPTGELLDPTSDPSGDLVRRAFERLAGRGDAEDPILVQQAESEEVLAREPLPSLAGEASTGPPASCRVPANPVIPRESNGIITRNRLLDHAFLATTLSLPRDRWQITDGWVLIEADGTMEWCRVEPTGHTPTCSDPGPVPLAVEVTPDQTGGSWAIIGGPIAARVADGVVVELAVLPRSTWRGSSLQGTVSWSGRMRSLDARNGQMVLEPIGDLPDTCVREGRDAEGTAVAVQYLDADTRVDVEGTLDTVELAERDLEEAPEVDLLVDRATCRALRVTDR